MGRKSDRVCKVVSEEVLTSGQCRQTLEPFCSVLLFLSHCGFGLFVITEVNKIPMDEDFFVCCADAAI